MDGPVYSECGRRGENSRGQLGVIPGELCSRCGACHVICPTNAIGFDKAEYPSIVIERCVDCGLCLEVCAGIHFDFRRYHQEVFEREYRHWQIGGFFSLAYVGYSRDPEIRAGGSSGGVVTHLLVALLAKGMIDGAAVVGNDPADPLVPQPIIARTEQQIRTAAQSKYVVVANIKTLRDVTRGDERIAFVGLPCQVQGLRKLQRLSEGLSQSVALIIGLACGGVLEREAVLELLAVRGIHPGSVDRIAFRDGHYPGSMRVRLRDGTVRPLHRHGIKDGAFNKLVRLYLAERCLLCSDYSAEFSDISCSDIWLRQRDGQHLHPDGATLILCRTERGQRIVESLAEAGEIAVEPIESSLVERAYRSVTWQKKTYPFFEARWRRTEGRPVPEYGLTVAISRTDWLRGALYRLSFVFRRSPVLRRCALRFLFSPFGEGLSYTRIKYKHYRQLLSGRNVR
ncbi:MAG: Coenzyme F420 hydrogenase/dehydrogenase, beta subunit C-terminal domain [Chloroflexota bacterium]